MTAADPLGFLARLDQARAAATPGEWTSTSPRADGGAYIDAEARQIPGRPGSLPWVGHAQLAADAAAIVAEHNACGPMAAALRAALALSDRWAALELGTGLYPEDTAHRRAHEDRAEACADDLRAAITAALDGTT